eukprot:2003229-Rhodomonas_salina.2
MGSLMGRRRRFRSGRTSSAVFLYNLGLLRILHVGRHVEAKCTQPGLKNQIRGSFVIFARALGVAAARLRLHLRCLTAGPRRCEVKHRAIAAACEVHWASMKVWELCGIDAM